MNILAAPALYFRESGPLYAVVCMKCLLLTFFLIFSVTAFGQDEIESEPPQPTPLLANSTLKARVYYEQTGRPVKRTSVLLMTKDGGPREASGITDANGMLVIRNLKAGKYFAVVNAPGAVSPLAYVDFRRARSDSFDEQLTGFPPIVVNGISDVEVAIPVKTGGAIGGRVIYENGDPAIGVKVEILRKVEEEYLATLPNLSSFAEMMMGGAGSFQTDDRGQYRFAGLPAGEYIVRVSEHVVHPTKGGDNNRYGFESMLFGSPSMLTIYFQDVFDRDKAHTLKVEFGQELSEINILIPDRRLNKLEGKLVAAKDKLPIRNARISLKREGEIDNSEDYGPSRENNVTYTDENGKWEFVELPKGKYQIVAQATTSEFDETDKAYGRKNGANYANNAANAMNVVTNTARYYANSNRGPEKPPAPKFSRKTQEFVLEEKDLTEQVIELSHGAVISGTVTVDGGKELPSTVTIVVADEEAKLTSSTSVSSYDYDYEENKRTSATSKDFVIDGISAGPTYLTVHSGDDEFYVKSVTAGETDLLKGPFDLKEAQSLQRVKIVLAKDSGKLEGKVVDAEKQFVPGVEIRLVPTDPVKLRNATYYRTVKSNGDGEFKATLPPFEYAAVIFPKRMQDKRRTEILKWLEDAVKKAPVFKIEAGKTVKATIAVPGKPS